MSFRKLALASGLLALGAIPAFADIYDVVSQFPTSNSNPNGVWTYGYETTLVGTFNQYTNFTNDYPNIGPGADGYYASSNLSAFLPTVLKNTTGGNFPFGSVTYWPANLLLMHPGSEGQYSVVRFTAPTAGQYLVAGSYFGLDDGPTTTDVHVAATQPNTGFSGYVDGTGTGPGSQVPFSFDVTLTAGQTVDFLVGDGQNGYNNDSTGLEATISNTPEPGFYGALALGLTGLITIVRRRMTASV